MSHTSYHAPSSRRHTHANADANSGGPEWWAVPLEETQQKARAQTNSHLDKSGRKMSLAVVREGIPEDIHEGQPLESTKRKTGGGRKMSWAPGWAFAGGRASTADWAPKNLRNGVEEEGEYQEELPPRTGRRESRLSVVGRRISSISESWVFQNEASHETNFPKTVEFPDQDGKKVNLRVFGTVDSLSPYSSEIRLQVPKGAIKVDLAEQKQYVAMLDYIKPKLKEGDMLVRPFLARYARDKDMAMVMRGAMQDYVYKCQIIGMFPMGVFGDEKMETYQLEVQLY